MHTNSNGSSLYWEFATDDYDIGFGLSFEWAKEPTSNGDVSTTCADTTKADSSQEVSPTKVQEIIPVKFVQNRLFMIGLIIIINGFFIVIVTDFLVIKEYRVIKLRFQDIHTLTTSR